MHFGLTSPLGSRESVGALSRNHYPTKTPGRVSPCSFSWREEHSRKCNLLFSIDSLLNQNYQVRTRENKNPTWGKSRYIPFLPFERQSDLFLFLLQSLRVSRERKRDAIVHLSFFHIAAPHFPYSNQEVPSLPPRTSPMPRKGSVLVWTSWNWTPTLKIWTHDSQLGNFCPDFSSFPNSTLLNIKRDGNARVKKKIYAFQLITTCGGGGRNKIK